MHLPDEIIELGVEILSRGVPVVGFHAPAGTGKSTTVSLLSHFFGSEGVAHARVPFASWLKTFLRTKLGVAKTPKLSDFPPDKVRELLQVIGTDLLRNQIDRDFHIKRWEEIALPLIKNKVLVLVEDVRFANEAKAIHNLGGLVIMLRRDGIEFSGGHESEQKLPEDLVDIIWDLPNLSFGM
jgi:hypothetical protein